MFKLSCNKIRACMLQRRAEHTNGRYSDAPSVDFTDKIGGMLAGAADAASGDGLHAGCGSGRNFIPLADSTGDSRDRLVTHGDKTAVRAEAGSSREAMLCRLAIRRASLTMSCRYRRSNTGSYYAQLKIEHFVKIGTMCQNYDRLFYVHTTRRRSGDILKRWQGCWGPEGGRAKITVAAASRTLHETDIYHAGRSYSIVKRRTR